MSRQLTLRPASFLQHRRRRLLVLAIALVVGLPTAVEAKTEFSSLLDLEMTIPGGAIHNKFGFATSFPKPAAAPPFGIKNGNPGGEQKTFTANGGTANIGPLLAADAMARKDVPKGRGMKLFLEGDTNAVALDGSIGQAEGWLSGTAKFRLGNITGRPDIPQWIAEKVTVDLDVTTLYDLFASATNDLMPTDRANAKVVYSLTNTSTGDVLIPETVFTVDDDDIKAPERIGPVKNTTTLSLTIPANTFYNLELFGHIYVAGESRGAAPLNPVPVNRPPGSIPNLPERMDQTLPDDGMRLPVSTTALFGDAFGHGGGSLLASAGVIGEDPLARHGLNTVMLESAVTSGHNFYDLEVAVEVPVNDFSQVAIQDVMGAASGFHGQFYNLQLGTGVGGEFQLSQDPTMLSLAGVESPFAPQDLTGAYQLMGFNDPFVPRRWRSKASCSRDKCHSSKWSPTCTTKSTARSMAWPASRCVNWSKGLAATTTTTLSPMG